MRLTKRFFTAILLIVIVGLTPAVASVQGKAKRAEQLAQQYFDQGDFRTAKEHYENAVRLRRQAGDTKGEAQALLGLGKACFERGESSQAIARFNEAQEAARKAGDRRTEAFAIDEIGKVYLELGEYQLAIDYYQRALPIEREVGAVTEEAYTLAGIARALRGLGEYQQALDYFARTLALRRAERDRKEEAWTLHNIGSVHEETGDWRAAFDHYKQALKIRRSIGDRKGVANTLHNLAGLHEARGEPEKALSLFNEALTFRRVIGDRKGETATLYRLARLDGARGKLNDGRKKIEEVINIVETLRTRINSRELRAAFFATVQDYYDLYIDLLMRMHKQNPKAGYDGAALKVTEKARARALLDLLAEARAEIRQGADPRLLERERELQLLLNAKAVRLQKLKDGTRADLVFEAERELRELNGELQQVESQLREKAGRYSALTQPTTLDLKEIQKKVLDSETVLLEYALGAERSYLWVVTPSSMTSYALAPRAELEAAARAAYEQLTAPNARTRGLKLSTDKRDDNNAAHAALARLSEMIIMPAAERLKGAERLLVVADGALQYIPFGALRAPGSESYRPLIVNHEITIMPSASALHALRSELKERKQAIKALAIIADPIFESSDARLKKSVAQNSSSSEGGELRGLSLEKAAKNIGGATPRIPRLPGTREEAERILALVPASERKQAYDFLANRATATSEELAQYRIIHFATHGFADTAQPQLSGLILSLYDEQGRPQDGFLRSHEIYNLNLPAELIVLSACETGLGKEIRGEGLIGLTRGFFYAGAARVVVSLWSVSDQATSELMARFYEKMLVGKLRPAAALRAAQIEMWNNAKWQAPFYWAAFQLQGEWQ